MRSAVPHSPVEGLSALSDWSIAGNALTDPLRLADVGGQTCLSGAGVSVAGVIGSDRNEISHCTDGPEAAVAELWHRMRLDPRHRVLWASPPTVVTARSFPGSAKKLASTTADLARLAPWLREESRPLYENAAAHAPPSWADRPLDPDSHARSCQVVQTRAASLAAVLCGTDPMAARRLLDATLRDAELAEAAALVQAVLQTLDAGWLAGTLTDLERQLALTLLQSALRLWLNVEEQPETIGCALVSALPGTPDLCGVMLKVALLRRAGWSVRLLLAQATDQIIAVAQDLQPDLIVLAGSRLSVRPGEMALLAGLLPALAADSAAPVILGGKLAETEPQTLLRLGGAAVCSAMAWIATIAAPLAPPKPPAQAGAGDGLQARKMAASAQSGLLAASRSRPA